MDKHLQGDGRHQNAAIAPGVSPPAAFSISLGMKLAQRQLGPLVGPGSRGFVPGIANTTSITPSTVGLVEHHRRLVVPCARSEGTGRFFL